MGAVSASLRVMLIFAKLGSHESLTRAGMANSLELLLCLFGLRCDDSERPVDFGYDSLVS